MTSSLARRTWGSSLLIAGMILPATAVGGSAFAAPTCAATTPAASLIAPGICEVVMTTSGTFTPPVGVSKVAAVLVGGGGGGYIYAGGYAGGGGEVIYVDSVTTGAAVTVTIGTGGQAGDFPLGSGGTNTPATNGTSTTLATLVARGGAAGTDGGGGASGSGQLGARDDYRAPGGGARTAAAISGEGYEPGAGYVLSQIPGIDTALFPAASDPEIEFGLGGSLASATPLAGSGVGGGYGFLDDADVSFDGANGSAIFRFPATVSPVEDDDDAADDLSTTPGEDGTAADTGKSDTLAATGVDEATLIVGALGLSLMVAGAVTLARPRRSTR